MKQITLLRHSKAGQTSKKVVDDHGRELTDKGIELCTVIAETFQENNIKPDYALCSNSVRTVQTLEEVYKSLGWNSDSKVEDETLYLAAPSEIISVIRNLPESVKHVVIVGHNPGLQQFAINFAGKGDKIAFRSLRSQCPPGACVTFNVETLKWADVNLKDGELTGYHISKPKRRKVTRPDRRKAVA